MLLKAALIIKGTDSLPIHGGCIAIEQDTIIAVGKAADFATSEVEQAIDYPSCTILPGLIDCHVHLFLEGISDVKIRQQRWKETSDLTLLRARENLKRALSKGVTTVRDLGGPYGISSIMQQAIKKKIFAGPRILTCNRAISITGGHFHYAGGREADGPAEIIKAVREQIKAGAECIKLMMTGMVNFQTENAGIIELTAEETQAAVTESRRFHCPVSVHANGIQGVRQALTAGVQTIEHGALLDEATIDLLSQSTIYWTPTLTPFLQMLNYSKKHNTPALPKDGLERVYTAHSKAVKRGIAAGAKIIAGTDAGALGVQHGDIWQEIALFVSLGMQPLQAIAAATGAAAKVLGISDHTGTISAGKNADILVVQGNPLKNMQFLQNIVQVYKDGVSVN
jgi:imidazolonepropionase-like amidohydrolase